MLTLSPKGFLEPDKSIETTLETFRQTFVDEMPNARRREIFENFEQFCHDVLRLTGLEMVEIWVNGSFVSQKELPEDIDFVLFLDAVSKSAFEKNWANQAERAAFSKARRLDFYFVETVPPGQPKYSDFISDSAYWHFQFTRGRRDRFGKSIRKGFISLKFTKNETQKGQSVPD